MTCHSEANVQLLLLFLFFFYLLLTLPPLLLLFLLPLLHHYHLQSLKSRVRLKGVIKLHILNPDLLDANGQLNGRVLVGSQRGIPGPKTHFNHSREVLPPPAPACVTNGPDASLDR